MAIKYYKREVNKNPIKNPTAHWSERQKMEACTTYLMCGNWVTTSAATGVPLDTLKKWGAAQWWKEMEEQVRRSSRLEMQGKLKRIVDKSINHLEDRLDNGDFVYDSKTGKIVRRPVQARTLSTVLSQSIDKSVLLEKLQTQPVQDQEQISSRLAKIQEEFKRFAKAKEIPGNAVIQELQKGLPAGEQVQIDSGADPQASPAEQSPQAGD
jgi:hypothetical protein